MLPCSCADDVEVLRQVRQKTTTMFKTITSAKALSVAHESVEQRGERAQRGQHLRLDARVVLDELRSSSYRPPLNFSCVFSRGVRRRVHGRSAASACAACAACAAVSGVGGESAAVGGRLVERRRRRREVLRSSEFGVGNPAVRVFHAPSLRPSDCLPRYKETGVRCAVFGGALWNARGALRTR